MNDHEFVHLRMAYLGWKKPLQEGDLWTLIDTDRTKYQIDILESHWATETEKMHRYTMKK